MGWRRTRKQFFGPGKSESCITFEVPMFQTVLRGRGGGIKVSLPRHSDGYQLGRKKAQKIFSRHLRFSQQLSVSKFASFKKISPWGERISAKEALVFMPNVVP